MSDAGPKLPDRAKRILGRLVDASARERILISFASLALALVVGAILLLASGAFATCGSPFLVFGGIEFCYNPIEVYRVMLNGAIGSPYSIGLTLRETTLLILAGVAVAVTFQAGIFNIGTQGQFVVGGLAGAALVQYTADILPANAVGGILLFVLGLAAAGVAGALYGALPGVLLAYYDANEVITTIMLNFIATAVAFTTVRSFLREGAAVQTALVPDYAVPPSIVFPEASSFSVLIFIPTLLIAFGAHYMLKNSPLGYNIRLSGEQPAAAKYSGVDAKRVIVRTFTLSGLIGGLTGGVFVFMVLGYWQPSVPQVGFDGITVSVLAANNPLGVIPAAALFGVIKSGAIALDLQLGVPRQLAGVLRGIIILFVAMPEFMRMIGRKFGLGETSATPAQEGITEENDD
ncbi:ABC transporter permease [Halostella sp. PRR32]|uniref:ABC transporter permease n=1 Tax=Halostella sp. PRR32 TaxID=3098147 RepID=UPI002B1E7756|nr:ABC transporter permease [Halostella sp. PRR32]